MPLTRPAAGGEFRKRNTFLPWLMKTERNKIEQNRRMETMCDTIFYPILILDSRSEIEKAKEFQILHYNWGGDYRPNTYGRMGVLRDKGLAVRMTCEEIPPEAVCHTNNGPVYQDSAMEFFFCLDSSRTGYFNFEINSAGAVLAQFGPDRAHREFLSGELLATCDCCVQVLEDSWQVDLFVPFSLIQVHWKRNPTTCRLCLGGTFLSVKRLNYRQR